MSSESTGTNRTPRWLALLTQLVVKHPAWVLLAAWVLAIVSIGYAATSLHFKPSRLDLLNPASQYNQRWLDYLEAFGRDDDAIVIFDGPASPRHSAIEQFVHSLTNHSPPLFDSILYRRDLEVAARLKEKGLHFASEEQRIEADQWLHDIDRFTPTGSGGRSVDLLAWLQSSVRIPANFHLLSQLLAAIDRALGPEPRYELFTGESENPQHPQQDFGPSSPAGANPREAVLHTFEQPIYLENDETERSFVLVRVARSEDGLLDPSLVQLLKQTAREVEEQFELVSVGLTGMPILETDEMQTSQSDMIMASIVSLLGVSCLFMIGFGGLRYPLMAVACLLLAMAWSFGYMTLVIGHLNLLSVSFGVILIGLGIDFGIHYLARYLEARSPHGTAQSMALDEAILESSTGVGPGILAGGITTSLAFFTAVLTQFTGIAELGVIAGGGILLCIVSALLVLPAMLSQFDRNRPAVALPAPLPLGTIGKVAGAKPRWTLLFSILVTAALATGLPRLTYDHNLLNLQAESLESVRLERELVEGSDQSVWFAVSYTKDPTQFARRKRAFEQLETVARTEDVISDLPTTESDARARIHRIHATASILSAAEWETPARGAEDVGQLQALLRKLAGNLDRAETPPHVLALVQSVQQQLHELPQSDIADRLNHLQTAMRKEIQERSSQLATVSNASLPTIEDLPVEVADRFVGHDGELLLRVYARGNIWDMDALEKFVRDVEQVDPHITGHPIQTFYASREMQRSYTHAAFYSLFAVAAVLMLDFQKIRLCLLAMIPMTLGLLQLFGLLGLLGIALNPANMIVLPLILGIGIDDGVHVVHDFLRQRKSNAQRAGPDRVRYRLSNPTATAIVLTSATTMVGFGSMMIAQHQGLQSLGQILTLGVSCCLLSSVVVLPALLTLVDHAGAGQAPSDRGDDGEGGDPHQEEPPEWEIQEPESRSTSQPSPQPRRRVRRAT